MMIQGLLFRGATQGKPGRIP